MYFRKTIPVSAPILPRKARTYLNDCIKTGWISSAGKYVGLFEKKFATYIGVPHAITAPSGTTALHLGLTALGISKGDEVIVPSFTMIAPVFAILYVGAKPVLVDSEIDTWNMNVSEVEKKITKKTRAILAVHIYGHPVDMDPLKRLAKKHKLLLIEDCAEALGAEYKGEKVGSLGDIGCFSFYANKIISTGEGGMVTTKSQTLAKRLLSLKDMAHSPKKRFLHLEVGFTYRLSNLQAAVGLAQTEEVERLMAKKREIATLYTKSLARVPGIVLPVEMPWAKNSYWMYGILVRKPFKFTKDALRRHLQKQNIETRDFFIPMHEQPVFKKLGLFKREKYPVAELLSKQGLYLPSGPNISISQIKKVISAIKAIV